jgi:hypothetical protein
MTARKMRLGLSIRANGYHPAAWRHPDVSADGTLQVEHYVRSTVASSDMISLPNDLFADGDEFRQHDNPAWLAVSNR